METVSKINKKTRQPPDERLKTSAKLADTFLQNAHIVATDGKPFGADGFIRFSYATSLENLQQAVEKIKKLIT